MSPHKCHYDIQYKAKFTAYLWVGTLTSRHDRIILGQMSAYRHVGVSPHKYPYDIQYKDKFTAYMSVGTSASRHDKIRLRQMSAYL